MTKFHHKISRGSESSVDYPRFSQTTQSCGARTELVMSRETSREATSTLREDEEFENAALFLRLGLP